MNDMGRRSLTSNWENILQQSEFVQGKTRKQQESARSEMYTKLHNEILSLYRDILALNPTFYEVSSLPASDPKRWEGPGAVFANYDIASTHAKGVREIRVISFEHAQYSYYIWHFSAMPARTKAAKYPDMKLVFKFDDFVL